MKKLVCTNIFFAFLGVMFYSNINAQEEKVKPITAVARSYKDRIVIRFFATGTSLFNIANKQGYVIEKSELISNIPIEKLNFKSIKNSPTKRWDEKMWESEFANNPQADSNEIKLAGFAMGLTDENANKTKTDILNNDLQSLNEIRKTANNNYTFVILASLQSKFASKGLGLWAEDFDVSLGKTYVYRIRINKKEVDDKNDWVYLKSTCKDFNENYLRSDTSIKVQEQDKAITFGFHESDDFFAFNVYRKKDKNDAYEKLNKTPSIKLSPIGYEEKSNYGYSDSGLTNYTKYYYKVSVLTPFVDELVLGEFVAMPKDKTPPSAPSLTRAKHIKPKEVEVSWQINLAENKDLKGFNIGRSDSEDGQYKKINKQLLLSNTTSFIDKEFNVSAQNYYVVEAVDTAGNVNLSFSAYVSLIDSTPPAKPIISSAIIDSLGKVIITIKPNTEYDFMGYQLLKANAADHDFSIVNQTFNDSGYEKVFIVYDSTTLNTLTKNIYYKLIGFDTHFNQSEDSKIIELKRRDTIPPTAPVITDYKLTDSSITILFVNSSSEDVIQNMLLRRLVGKEKYDTIFRNNNSITNSFLDVNIVSANQYEYCMVAKDEAKLYSKLSNSIILKSIENKRLPPPTLNIEYIKSNNTIAIKIGVNEKLVKQNITVTLYFRYNVNDEWQVVKTEKLEKANPLFHQLLKGTNSVYYTATITNEKGKTSIFSKEEKLNY